MRLFLEGKELTVLPDISEDITNLFCYDNQLTALPSLPLGLEVLNCHNKSTYIPSTFTERT